MRFKSILLIALLTVLVASLSFAGDKYEIDVVHSTIGFSARHLVISNTRGVFKDFSGVIILDENDISKSLVNVTIKAASLSTDNERRDGHVKSADFLDVENHPEITFKSKSIAKVSDGYTVTGDLTIRGTTREVTFPFTLVGPVNAMGGTRLGAEATLTINRQDFGVSWSKTLDNGGLVVSNEIKLTLEVEAIKVKEEGTN
ncbi:MAG: YceI family protein [bacterium]